MTKRNFYKMTRSHRQSMQDQMRNARTHSILNAKADDILRTAAAPERPELRGRTHAGSWRSACYICNRETDRIVVTRGRGSSEQLSVFVFCGATHAREAGFGWAGR
jgi:hypothetical protein